VQTPSTPTIDAAAVPAEAPGAPTHCWRLALTVFAQYFLLALDIRYVTTRNYLGIVIVNALIALMGWYVVRGIVQAHSVRERVAYVMGGTLGAVVAVSVS
jgi:hypothetical protein